MPRSSQSRTGPAGVTPGPSSAWPVWRPSCSIVLRGGLISGCPSQQSTSPPLAVLKGNHPVCSLFLWLLLFCVMFVRCIQVVLGYGSFILLEAWSLIHWNYQGNPWFIYLNCRIIRHWMTLPQFPGLLYYWQASEMFPVWGCCEQASCVLYVPLRVDSRSQGVCNIGPIEWCKGLYHVVFTISTPTSRVWNSLSLQSLPELGFVGLFHFLPIRWEGKVSLCCFNSYFPHYQWGWVTFLVYRRFEFLLWWSGCSGLSPFFFFSFLSYLPDCRLRTDLWALYFFAAIVYFVTCVFR